MNIKKPEQIIGEIIEKISSWNNYAEEVKVEATLRDAINGTLIKM